MPIDATATPSFDPHALDRDASALMKRGIGLLAAGGPAAAPEALACFDEALELRNRLPADDDPGFRYGLAACWLNRAEALMLSGEPDDAGLAVASCDRAIALLRDLPLAVDARYPRRLAIAHQNRGLALLAHDPANTASAILAFTEAATVLDSDPGSFVADRRYLQAAVYLNLANTRASEGTIDSDLLARDAAVRAMSVVASAETEDAGAAEVGLKARHVCCRIVSRQIARAAARDRLSADDVHEATDLVDEGLTLAHVWERRGDGRLRTLAFDLFQFGALVYGRYQPQFFAEFVLENLDPARTSEGYAAMVAGTVIARHLQSQADIV